ncbi:thioredoxin [Kitasatospora sp. CM 4170]|uniref:Thioredoxin n=1 Tax=Kitasatospora aburaviensis TaxID=67265 RepID=A0ABW1EVP0_9ACTN|nr:thioredoxin [Kitasatospora sp. CM 4170]WNM49619.1 thioredoxin [Kitasatospora sp. CM 4170]
MPGTTITATDSNFEELVFQSDKPVLVDFWATWCPPCRMIAPTLDQIAAEHGDRLTVVKVDIDKNPALATQYGIMSIPTLKVFTGGKAVKTIVGALPKDQLKRNLADFIG